MRRTVETERTAPRGDLAYWSRTGERLIAIVDYALRSVTSILVKQARGSCTVQCVKIWRKKILNRGLKDTCKSKKCVQLKKCSRFKWGRHAVSHARTLICCIVVTPGAFARLIYSRSHHAYHILNTFLCGLSSISAIALSVTAFIYVRINQ